MKKILRVSLQCTRVTTQLHASRRIIFTKRFYNKDSKGYERANMLYNEAMVYQKQGNTCTAIDYLKMASKEQHDNTDMKQKIISGLIIFLTQENRLEEAREYLDQYKQLDYSLNQQINLQLLCNILAEHFLDKGRIKDSHEVFEDIAKYIHPDFKLSWTSVLLEFGKYLKEKNYLDEAIVKFKDIISITKELSNKDKLVKNERMREAYYEMGKSYDQKGDGQHALESFNEAISLTKELGDENTVFGADLLHWTADTLVKHNMDIKLGFDYAERARQILFNQIREKKATPEIIDSAMQVLLTQAKCYEIWGQIDKAIALCTSGLELANSDRSFFDVIGSGAKNVKDTLVGFYLKKKSYKNAIPLLQELVDECEDEDYLRKCYTNLKTCFEQEGKIKEALECTNKLIELNDRNDQELINEKNRLQEQITKK